jgi:sugar/nucleoside kinase (ribokinase family)/fructoselysine-6-P-deglycase FrlB-like protein
VKDPVVAVAYADLIYDHLFSASGRELVYRGSRGGGSALNTLSTLAWLRRDDEVRRGNAYLGAVGSGGDDLFGRLALAELAGLGIETAWYVLSAGRETRQIFELISSSPRNAVRGDTHGFSGSCPICGTRGVTGSGTWLSAEPTPLRSARPSFAIFDKLTARRYRLVHELRLSSATCVLDLGAASSLRWSAVGEILAWLASFEVVCMTQAVAASLMRRSHLMGEDELARLAGSAVLLVTRGAGGLDVIGQSRREHRRVHIPAPACDVVDDAGAGDAFLAHVIDVLATRAADPEMLSLDSVVDASRQALAGLQPVLGSVGARGHLPDSLDLLTPAASNADVGQARLRRHLIGATRSSLLTQGLDERECPICLASLDSRASMINSTLFGEELDSTPPPTTPVAPRRAKSKSGSRANLARLMTRSMATLERLEAMDIATDLLDLSGSAYVVGSGGSYAAAQYIATLLETRSQLFPRALHPREYVSAARRSDVVVAVTYSGSTPDIAHVLRRARDLGVPNVFVLTASQRPDLGHDFPEANFIRYGPPRPRSGFELDSPARRHGTRERGFVSIAGTVLPCFLMAAATYGRAELIGLARRLDQESNDPSVELARKLSKEIDAARSLLCFGSGFAWPALLDLESKFVEAAVCDVQIHESKDFSHGRFMSVLGEHAPRPARPAALVSVGRPSRYDNELIEILRKNEHHVGVLQSVADGPLGGLELLIRVQRLAQLTAEDLGRDLSRPGNPSPDGLRLYRYKRDSNR